MNDQRNVQRLQDLESIRDLARRYAHCIWNKDAAGAAQLFTDDGCMDPGMGEPVCGRAALTSLYQQAFAASTTHPFVHNHVIEISGDTATGTCHLDLRIKVGENLLVASADCQDTYVRQGGAWFFRTRKLTMHEQVPIAT